MLFIEWCTPGVLLFTYRGYVEASAVEFFEPLVDQLIDRGVRPRMFVDVWDVTGYTSEFRREITRWTAQVRPRVEPLQMLLRSKLIAMCVAVVHLAIGGEFVVMHTERLKFNVALRAAMRASP